MTKPAGTPFSLAAVAVLAETSDAQSTFPEDFGSAPAGERGPAAVFVAPCLDDAM